MSAWSSTGSGGGGGPPGTVSRPLTGAVPPKGTDARARGTLPRKLVAVPLGRTLPTSRRSSGSWA